MQARPSSFAALGVTLALGLATACLALEYAQLSEEARKLVPEAKMVQVTDADGAVYEGAVVSDDPEKIVIRVRKSGAATMSKLFRKAAVRGVRPMPVDDAFAAKLLEIEIDPPEALPAAEYRRLEALHAEFLKLSPQHAQTGPVAERLASIRECITMLDRGMERIRGQWLAPVQAAVMKFAVYTEQIAQVEGQGDWASNARLKATRDELVEKRAATARSLPGLMQAHVPKLLTEKAFKDAVDECMAFLRFWMDQVVAKRGPAAEAIREMDFGYILRMERSVMEAYRAAGKGAEPPPRGLGVPPDMVYIPGGYFLMGSAVEDPNADDFPLHIVFVSPFLLDRREVSNAAYRKFVEHVKATGDYSTAHPDAPPLKKHDADGWSRPELGGDKQPVVGVDWYDAYAYAKWVGKRLPTEAEWEKAARGMDGRLYTWGDGDPASTCGVNWQGGRDFIASEMDRQNPAEPPQDRFGCGCVKEIETTPPPPTRLPAVTWDTDKTLPERALVAIENDLMEWTKECASPFPLLHMAGNAAEWVSDAYARDYYRSSPVYDPAGPEAPAAGAGAPAPHVFRGGSYLTADPRELATFWRGNASNRTVADGNDGGGNPMIGFRCARSLDIVR